MSTTFRYDYDEMMAWFERYKTHTRYFESCDELRVHKIRREEFGIKYGRNDKKQTFLYDSVLESHDIKRIKFIIHERFPNGLYLLKAKTNKDAMFVFPTQLPGTDTYKCDHFSIPYNEANKKRPVQLHVTQYFPDPNDIRVGGTTRWYNELASRFEFPISGPSPLIKKLHYYNGVACDVLRAYYVQREMQHGNGKRLRESRSIERVPVRMPTTMNVLTPELNKRLKDHKIKSIDCIGIKNNGDWHMTMYVDHQLHGDTTASISTVYRTKRPGRKQFLKRLEDWLGTWETMH